MFYYMIKFVELKLSISIPTNANSLSVQFSRSACPTLCDPKNRSPPRFPVHGILQERLLEWVAIAFSRDLPDSGIKPGSLCIGRRILYR